MSIFSYDHISLDVYDIFCFNSLTNIRYVVYSVSNEKHKLLCVELIVNPIDNHHYRKNYFLHPNEIDTISRAKK